MSEPLPGPVCTITSTGLVGYSASAAGPVANHNPAAKAMVGNQPFLLMWLSSFYEN